MFILNNRDIANNLLSRAVLLRLAFARNCTTHLADRPEICRLETGAWSPRHLCLRCRDGRRPPGNSHKWIEAVVPEMDPRPLITAGFAPCHYGVQMGGGGGMGFLGVELLAIVM
jgi:hypothetical protein